MAAEKPPGKPTTRRYTDTEKAQAVRLVRELRKELGTEHGTVYRVANQLGYGVESVRAWVRQANVDDGVKPGISSEEAVRIKELEQEGPQTQQRVSHDAARSAAGGVTWASAYQGANEQRRASA